MLFFCGFFLGKFSLKFVLGVVFAFILGVFCFFTHDVVFRVRALKLDGTVFFVNARVVDVKKNCYNKEAYVLKIERLGNEKLVFPIFTNVYSERGIKFFYGDRIEAKINFFAKKNVNKMFFSPSKAKNIYLNGKILELNNVNSGTGFFYNFHMAREDLIDVVDFVVSSPANLLVNSVFLGQDYRMPYEIKRGFDCCGLSHIFAVSGLHISILFACLFCCLRFLRVPKWVMAFILIFLLFCYNVLLGFCVSAIRASLMNLAYFYGTLFGKKLNSVYLLCFVAILILIFLPGSVFSCSFVLSFSSCCGILLFFKQISFVLRRRFLIFSGWPKLFIDCFALSVSSLIFSSFFMVLFFGKISLIAPIVNLLIVPFIPSILVFSGLTAISGFFGFFGISSFFGYFCEGIFYELVFLTKLFSKLPFCFIPTRYFFVLMVVLGLIVFLMFVFLYARRLLFSKTVALFCALIIFVPTLTNYVLAKGSSSISIIGNGSGFSTVITSAGKVIVLNCGGFDCEKNLCNFLDSRGIKRIDFLIFLSNDLRYKSCNLRTILNCVETFCVIMPFEESAEQLVKVLAESHTRLVFAEQAHFVSFPVTVDFLNSDKDKRGFNCYIDLGGLSFSYCLSGSEFKQMQSLRFVNVAIVDDYVEANDEGWNCGFLISTKPGRQEFSHFYSALPYEITDFVIYGSYIKRMSL